MSPHEMTTKRLEELVEEYDKLGAREDRYAEYFLTKADNLRKILKDRVDDGSYDSDVDPDTGDRRY